MESSRLLCAGMPSTFVGDLERYRRWEKRKHTPVKPGIAHQNEMIQQDYRSALAMDRWDYVLSLDECYDELRINPDEYLARRGFA